MKRIYAIGDIHGDIDRFKLLLSQNNIIDSDENWNIGDSTFVSIGDVVDRGEKGIETIQYIQTLEKQAEDQGGQFVTLCGNHDACMVAAAYETLGKRADRDCAYIFKYNGGSIKEAEKIAQDETLFEWLKQRPLMFKIGNLLFQHADTTKYYLSLGETIEDINNAGFELLTTAPGAFQIFYEMTDCRYFDRYSCINEEDHENSINEYMNKFDVNTILHGHTRFVGNEPQIYFDNKIINIDGSLSNGYRNDPDRGFIVSFSETEDFFTFDKTQI